MKTTLTLMALFTLVACSGNKNKGTQTPAPTPANPNPPVTSVASGAYTFRQDVRVAVFDSGVDITNTALAPQIFVNPHEIANDNIDNDSNGFVDDKNGWNFIDNNGKVFDYETLSTLPSDLASFTEQQSDKYSTISHGTHVAGIVVKDNVRARILPIKILATDTESDFGKFNAARFFAESAIAAFRNQTTNFGKAINYASNQGALVANGSFSVSAAEIKDVINENPSLQRLLSGFNLPIVSDGVIDLAITTLLSRLGSEFASASNTLFVFAAGNEAQNNDNTIRIPANVRKPNTITVAATKNRSALAEFSNYSSNLVDVAAPGVGIESTMPNNKTDKKSGTSMAAPYVANVAAQVRSINPQLNVAATRRILMETVDVKDFLKGKIVTAGIVNAERARKAAELSLTLTLDNSISAAKTQVADAADDK